VRRFLAQRVGAHGVAWANKTYWAGLSIVRGDLIAAERDAEEARSFGEAHEIRVRLRHRAVFTYVIELPAGPAPFHGLLS
jgi:hypothetical protein